MNDDRALQILTDIRNWTRAASYESVKSLLQTSLPDAKARAAYQMLNGSTTFEQVCRACKLSKPTVVMLAHRWVAKGLMEVTADQRRARLFNLEHFELDPVAAG